MERSKIEQFMLLNAGNFSESDLVKIQNKLESVPEEYATLVLGTEFKKPTTALIISFLGGGLGIDRFYLGQTGKGILKLITCGGFSIWAIIDLFIIMGAAREYNTNKLISIINQFTSKKAGKVVTEPTRSSNEAYQPKIESANTSDEASQTIEEPKLNGDETSASN